MISRFPVADLLPPLAPFLSQESLDELVTRVTEGTLNVEHLPALAPFLSRPAMAKVLQHVADGKISPDVIVGLAPFLDKDTLVQMIRGSGSSRSPDP